MNASDPTHAQRAAGPTAGRPDEAWSDEPHPTDGRPFYSLTFRLTKFTHYKPNGRRQMGGAKGRWQERGEYGGWDNCSAPTGPWILSGRTVPDALRLANGAPAMAAALQGLVDLFDDDGCCVADLHEITRPLAAARAALRSAGPSRDGEGECHG